MRRHVYMQFEMLAAQLPSAAFVVRLKRSFSREHFVTVLCVVASLDCFADPLDSFLRELVSCVCEFCECFVNQCESE